MRITTLEIRFFPAILRMPALLLLVFALTGCDSRIHEYLNEGGSIHSLVKIPLPSGDGCTFEGTVVTDDPPPYYHSPNIHAHFSCPCKSADRIKAIDVDLLENGVKKFPDKISGQLNYFETIYDNDQFATRLDLKKPFGLDRSGCSDSAYGDIRVDITKRFKTMDLLPQNLTLVFTVDTMEKKHTHSFPLTLRSSKDTRAPFRFH